MRVSPPALIAPLLLLAACASTPPLDFEGTDRSLTPAEAAAHIETARGRRVAWGGVIVSTRNLEHTTEIETLGYPLDDSGRPQTGAPAQRRFLLVREGYLEAADFRSGRLVTAVGGVTGTRRGRVGEAEYVYPVLEAEEIYLWPLGERAPQGSNVRFGVGIGVIIR
ncbi:MAG TPA: Slp family lipoprotein [Burkholderiales bacterium]